MMSPNQRTGSIYLTICTACLTLAFQSCGPLYFPGIFLASTPPVIYRSNPETNQNYRNFGIDACRSLGSNIDEKNYLLRGRYVIANNTKYGNANVGLIGYTGTYDVQAVEEHRGLHPYIGTGFDGNFNIWLPIQKFKIGLGLYVGGVFEFGSYQSFMYRDDDGSSIKDIEKIFTPLAALYPIVSYQLSNSSSISFQFGFGVPGILSPSLTYNGKIASYWLSMYPSVSEYATPKYQIAHISLGASFQLPESKNSSSK